MKRRPGGGAAVTCLLAAALAAVTTPSAGATTQRTVLGTSRLGARLTPIRLGCLGPTAERVRR